MRPDTYLARTASLEISSTDRLGVNVGITELELPAAEALQPFFSVALLRLPWLFSPGGRDSSYLSLFL